MQEQLFISDRNTRVIRPKTTRSDPRLRRGTLKDPQKVINMTLWPCYIGIDYKNWVLLLSGVELLPWMKWTSNFEKRPCGCVLLRLAQRMQSSRRYLCRRNCWERSSCIPARATCATKSKSGTSVNTTFTTEDANPLAHVSFVSFDYPLPLRAPDGEK